MYQKYILPLFIAGTLFTSCKQKDEAQTAKPIEVPVVNVRSVPLELDHLYVADIQAVRNVEIRSKISGFLDHIYVDEGQTVKKGQILFKIGDTEFKSEHAKAKAALNSAKAETRIAELEYERVKLMVEKKIISQSELDLALSKLHAAKARAEEAQSAVTHANYRLSYTTITAPFDGVVDRIPLKTGSLVSEGTLITTVSDISSMYAYFSISENEYLAFSRTTAGNTIDENRNACLVLSDGQDYDCRGKIETVVSEFNESTGAISVRASFPNPKQLLKHRATGKVRLTTAAEESLVVPQKAAFEIQDKSYVYVLGADNVVKMKSFVPSGRVDQYYIIRSGLAKGDKIVYEGIQNLKEGMKVLPRQLSPDSMPQIASNLKK